MLYIYIYKRGIKGGHLLSAVELCRSGSTSSSTHTHTHTHTHTISEELLYFILIILYKSLGGLHKTFSKAKKKISICANCSILQTCQRLSARLFN